MRVGFIGIGAMGLPMAVNILNSGKKLFVFDIRDAPTQSLTEKGAVRCSSIGSLSEESEIVMMSLPGPEEVRTVASEVLESMSAGNVLVDLSTNSPSLIREIDSMAKLKNVSFLDAPVSGGTRGAKSGELTVMVGGEKGYSTRLDQYGTVSELTCFTWVGLVREISSSLSTICWLFQT